MHKSAFYLTVTFPSELEVWLHIYFILVHFKPQNMIYTSVVHHIVAFNIM